MKVLVLSSNELEEKEINNTLEELQKIVGGYIEVPFLSQKFLEHKIDIIINEEGKFIDGLKPEIAVVKKGTNNVLDIVYGNCVFASHDAVGNTIALNEEQIKVIKKELKLEVVLHDGKSNKDFISKVLFI